MSERRISVGIDNGISGALFAITADSAVVQMLTMPCVSARKGNEIDVEAVSEWLDSFGRNRQIAVTIEEPGGSLSASAGVSMAGSFHALRTICILKKLRWNRITPQSWQKVMLPGCKSGDTKPRALAAAKALWPDESFLATTRCRVPHDGLVDAALIAEYARRNGM